MTEEEFWNTTPKKLHALLSIHLKITGGGEEDKSKVVMGNIDQIPGF